MCNVVLALPAECWRWYDGYEGIAQVSTRGDVKTVDRWVTYPNGSKRFFKGVILKQRRDKKGYLHVTLHRDGKARTFLVHRMVAETFIPNPDGKPQVNHRDEDKTNNSVENGNLEWVSASENLTWGIGAERRVASLSKAVLALDPKTGVVIKEFPSIAEAGRKGFSRRHVYSCCNGKKLSHKGFVWRYKDDYDQESAWTPVKIGGEAIAASQLNGSKSKAVLAIDPETGQVVLEFPSAREAERKGFGSRAISKCCRGVKNYKTHKGYVWRYKE